MNQSNNKFLLEERQPAREYKDRLFRMIFKEKEKFLELYNAPILWFFPYLVDISV